MVFRKYGHSSEVSDPQLRNPGRCRPGPSRVLINARTRACARTCCKIQLNMALFNILFKNDDFRKSKKSAGRHYEFRSWWPASQPTLGLSLFVQSPSGCARRN